MWSTDETVNFEIFGVLEIRIEIVLLRLSCLYIVFIIDRHIGKSKKCLTYDYHLNQKANHKFYLLEYGNTITLRKTIYINDKNTKLKTIDNL